MLANLLHIYQADFYDTKRFLRFVYSNWRWGQLSRRGTVDWTLRAKFIYATAVVLAAAAFAAAGWIQLWLIPPMLFAVIIAAPVLLVLANYLTMPAVALAKRRIINRARAALARAEHLDVIGITGSFGKTTTKEALRHILAEERRVLSPEQSINTDIGVAQFILAHEHELRDYDVCILEMGAHHRGDISELCRVAPPDYSILTAIGPAHLERFGSLEAIAEEKFQLPRHTKKKAFLNTCNDAVREHAAQMKDATDKFVGLCGLEEASDAAMLENFSGTRFTYDGTTYTTKLLGEHILELLVPCIALARELGLSRERIQERIAALPQVPHRLQVTHNTQTGVTVIDDSYNGNPSSFRAGLAVLTHAPGRQVVLTPGMVELGELQEREHRAIAREYAAQVDLVLLVENSSTRYIVDEFEKQGFAKYKTYAAATEAHTDLPTVLQSGDTILFQNDWPDQYQ